MRGFTRAKLGQTRLALADLGRAIELEPANVEARRHRAMVYRHLGEPDKAVEDYDEILRRFPGSPSTIEERRLALEQAAEQGRAEAEGR